MRVTSSASETQPLRFLDRSPGDGAQCAVAADRPGEAALGDAGPGLHRAGGDALHRAARRQFAARAEVLRAARALFLLLLRRRARRAGAFASIDNFNTGCTSATAACRCT